MEVGELYGYFGFPPYRYRYISSIYHPSSEEMGIAAQGSLNLEGLTGTSASPKRWDFAGFGVVGIEFSSKKVWL